MTPLSDNLPGDRFYYHISVQTGLRKQAATDSKVKPTKKDIFKCNGVLILTLGNFRGRKTSVVGVNPHLDVLNLGLALYLFLFLLYS